MAPFNFPNLVQRIISLNNMTASNGSVISFYYKKFKHDPYPVIITTGFYPQKGLISGLNLHYLSFPVFRALLNQWAGNTGFTYFLIRNEPIIKEAFRKYKLTEIINIKKVDYKSIIALGKIIRNYSSEEIQKIKDAVDLQVLSRQPEILNELIPNITSSIGNNNNMV